MTTVWERNDFPTHDYQCDPRFRMHCDKWLAAKKTMAKPLCWTPTKAFTFGGKDYIPLYPCIAFATKNAGFVIQKTWAGFTWGRE